MRATDIIRYRRQRAQQANRSGPKTAAMAARGALLLLLSLMLAVLIPVGAAAAFGLALTANLPDVETLATLSDRYAPGEPTRLYGWAGPDASGQRGRVLIDEIIDPRLAGSPWLSLGQIPPAVIEAALAAEDPDFLTAPPLNLRAMWQSGLTTATPPPLSPLIQKIITSELYDGQEVAPDDIAGHWQMWLLGTQIEQRFGRERVLEWTLNTRYYGHLAYGIEAAAAVYFGKAAADLSPAEAALLVAAGLNPAANPFDDPAAARQGQAAVWSALGHTGDAAWPELARPPGTDSAAPHFARLARQELAHLLGPRRLALGGLTIDTTLDMPQQQQAACTLASHLAGDDAPPVAGGRPACPAAALLPDPAPGHSGLRGTVVALDSASGAIKALWANEPAGAALPARPTGSLVRPFIYLTALSRGYTAASLLYDVAVTYLQDGQTYRPENADGSFSGPLRLRQAAAGNQLVPAVQALSWVGAERVLNNARALGITIDDNTPASDLTLAETGFPATLLDLTHAFAAIDNSGALSGAAAVAGGLRPVTIDRILDDSGSLLYEYEPARQDMVAPELAYLLTSILSDAAAVSCGEISCPAAIATGESVSTGDAWTIGYTPGQVIGVWVGPAAEVESAAAADLSGSHAASPVWSALTGWSLASVPPPTRRPQPPGLVERDVCAVSGLLPSAAARCETVRELFVDGTEPTAVDTLTREIAINRETGRLATIFTPPALIERQTYTAYPPEAAAWAAAAGVKQPPTEYDTIGDIPTQVGDAALNIEPWAIVGGRVAISGTAASDNFASYRLAFFPGLLPEGMRTIVEPVETPVVAGLLGEWDTTPLTDGLYTLLLTVIRQDGTFTEVAVPVMVENQQ